MLKHLIDHFFFPLLSFAFIIFATFDFNQLYNYFGILSSFLFCWLVDKSIYKKKKTTYCGGLSYLVFTTLYIFIMASTIFLLLFMGQRPPFSTLFVLYVENQKKGYRLGDFFFFVWSDNTQFSIFTLL